MIGDYKGFVKNKVVVALLQAYHDILDYDGMKSILKEAGMIHIKDIRDKNPNDTLDFFSFKKIISAQNCLLYDSSDLLYEIGKKFSFYLFPFGKSFEEIIQEVNSSITTDWKVSIIENNENEITISVEQCIFCSEIGVPCDLFKGFLFNSLQKSLPSDHRVIYDRDVNNVNNPSHNSFIVKLKIDKSIK
jgi:predicted hydrocarbon binding protein